MAKRGRRRCRPRRRPGHGETGDARERRVRPCGARTLSPFTRDDSAAMVAVGGCRRPRATESGVPVLLIVEPDADFLVGRLGLRVSTTTVLRFKSNARLALLVHARSRRPLRLSRPLPPPNRTGSQAHPKNVRRRGREPARSAREQDGARGGHPPREEDLRARCASRARQRGRGGVRPRRGLRVRYVSDPRFFPAGETRARHRASFASTTRDRQATARTFSNSSFFGRANDRTTNPSRTLFSVALTAS